MIKTVPKPEIILILGMHRSGTSMVAQMVARWGAYMGKDMMLADVYNQDGYWEFNPLVDFHDKLLKRTNNKWFAPSNKIKTKELLIEFGYEAEQLVHLMDQQGCAWCWKDPRMTLFLDFWQKVLAGREVIYLATYRSPLDIARSVSIRDKLPASITVSLWEFSTEIIFAALSANKKYIFIDYEKTISNPEIKCKELFQFLNESIQVTKSNAVADSMIEAVKSNLNHAESNVLIATNPRQQELENIYLSGKIPESFVASEVRLREIRQVFSLFRKLSMVKKLFN